jgi:geranylgeranyl diphosphate synthase type II
LNPETTTELFRTRGAEDRASVEKTLGDLIEQLAAEHAGMREAVTYSLLGGGKRLRPILCLWTHDLVGGTRRDVALDAACAIECIHTYSLIHDDLPCMDDDDYRRGKESSHKKFGEATAVLAGDALLTLAFQVISTIPERRPGANVEDVLEMSRVLAYVAGTGGLITGQALDLAGSARSGDLEAVKRIHENKTARLIAGAMEIGAVVGGARSEDRERIKSAGTLAGAAFQIADDILDCVKDRDTLGKTPGKDALAEKLTYPSVVGIDRSRAEAAKLSAAAKSELPDGDDTARHLLSEMIDFLVERGA